MARDPLKDAEIEIVCPRCGYRMMRTAARLRRGTKLVCPECGEDIMPDVPERTDDHGH
jgi:DNA-directed RNA polymerase subunit RPC12/RpoP